MALIPCNEYFPTHGNSQLLDLLFDVNESKRIPPHLHYDLRSPTPDAGAVPALEPDRSPSRVGDASGALAALAEARAEIRAGQITPRSYKTLEVELLQTIDRPSRVLAQLEAIPHTTLASVTPNLLPCDLDDAAPIGYYSPNHEQEYLSTLDNNLGAAPGVPRLGFPLHTAKLGEREKEKDAQLRNPVSVHNWLRKHHPSVFLQDEPNPDKIPPKNATKVSPKPPKEPKSTKKSTAAPKQEQEIIDDEGYVIGGNLEVPTKNKRKREDEPYRPKGGSSRSSKRKKISLGATARRNAGEDEGG